MMASGLLWRWRALYIARPLITVWGIGGGVMDGIAVKRTLGFPLLFILGGNRKKTTPALPGSGKQDASLGRFF